MKKNYQTSEFWFTVVSFIFSGLFLLGLIKDFDQKEELISDVSHGVESVILLSGQFAVLYRYINSRNEQKKASKDLELAKEISKQVQIALSQQKQKEEEEEDDQHRIDLSGSSETDSDSQS